MRQHIGVLLCELTIPSNKANTYEDRSRIAIVGAVGTTFEVLSAFALGAWGYVVKTRASTDLLAGSMQCVMAGSLQRSDGSEAHYSKSDSESN